MLDWMRNNPEDVLATSVHIAELEEMSREKSTDKFEGIRFVYLHAEKEEISKRLCARGERPDTVTNVASAFAKDDAIYRQLADFIIETTHKGIDSVVSELKTLD